jgi:hypothetical protein
MNVLFDDESVSDRQPDKPNTAALQEDLPERVDRADKLSTAMND